MLQRYQEIADERYAARLAEYEKRLKKAQEDGIVPVEEPKEPKKAKRKVTKDTTAKKKTKATKKSASAKGKKTTTKKTSGTKKSTTSSKKAKSAKLDEDADQWISSDDED